MTTTTINHRLAGIWLESGYQRERSTLEVTLIGQRLYDRETLYLAGPDAALLTVESDGELRGWGRGVRFAPDAGELARIGVKIER